MSLSISGEKEGNFLQQELNSLRGEVPLNQARILAIVMELTSMDACCWTSVQCMTNLLKGTCKVRMNNFYSQTIFIHDFFMC